MTKTINTGFLVALVLLISCRDKNSQTADTTALQKLDPTETGIELTDSQRSVAGIKTGTMEQKKLSVSVRLMGEVIASPEGFESIVVPVGGIIKQIRVKPGELVKTGQVLFVLAGTSIIDWQQEYLEATQQLNLHENNWERDKQLFDKKAISEKQWQESQSQYKISMTKAQAALARLALLGITEKAMEPGKILSTVAFKSPVDGAVETVLINQGQFAATDAVVLRIAKPSAQQWVLKAQPQEAESLNSGNRVTMSFINGQSVNGSLESVSSSLGENNLVNIYVKPNPLAGWRPRFGSTFTAEVYLDNSMNWVLPESAVIESEGKQYCFLAKSDRFFVLKQLNVLGKSDGYWLLKSQIPGNIVMQGGYWVWMQMNQSEE